MTAADTVKTAAEQFARDTANHTLTVMHDDGLYRHLRFAQSYRSGYWFDIVTWPGSLAVRGDMGGGYVFSRLTDMFEFFRANGNEPGRINPGYWAEKLPAGGRSVREYSEDVFRAQLAPDLAEYERLYPELLAEYNEAKPKFDALPFAERYPMAAKGMREPFRPTPPDEVREMVADVDADGLFGYEDGARRLLADLESARVVADTFEWNLSTWSYEYLWFCNAIVWGIRQYDTARVELPA